MSQQANRIDPNLSLLHVPQPARPRSALDNASSANPLLRFYSEPDPPWSSQRMRSAPFSNGRSSLPQPNPAYGSYREGPTSEVESLAPRSDSGYYTHPTHSIMSHDQERCDQEPPSEILQIRNIHVSSASSETTEMHPNRTTDQVSQYSGRSTANGKEFKCPQCGESSKCKSDHKKHMLKHEKPFKCDIQNCRRGGKGFTTVNDLKRHKKSVHQIDALQDSYQCASDNCRNKDKIWPRLDNFKQHIHRMHREEDESNLIRRSKFQAQQTPTVETPSVAPMDTTLAGIAPDRQFSNTGFDEPTSGMSLTPDQAPNSWPTFPDPGSTQEFALDVDQSNPNRYGQNIIKPTVHVDIAYKPPGQKRTVNYDASAASLPSGPTHRNNSSKLETLATVASSQSSPDKPVSQPSLRLSREPQTKAEQQKQALQKLSKMISGEIAGEIRSASSAAPRDLENVVMRVLYHNLPKLGRKDASSATASLMGQGSQRGSSAGQSVSKDTFTKKEALKAAQAMSDLIKNGEKNPIGVDNRTKPVWDNMKACEHCSVTLARSCDMKKHMKRHTKPYGCTYPKCHKRFGAKSDWKRHENSQHFQLESYRCQYLSPSLQTPCGELFYRQELFKQHLEKEHKKIDDEEIEQEIKLRRIGRNGQGQFWCGFCFEIVKLKKKRNAAWDERFNHIDCHFTKDGKRIEEWHCIQAKKTKGQVLKEMDRNLFEEEEDGDPSMENETNASSDSPDESAHHPPPPPPPPPPPQSQSQSQSHNAYSMPPPPPPGPGTFGSMSNKRGATDNPPSQPPPHKRERRTKHYTWYCCQCQAGGWNTRTDVSCMDCLHDPCPSCQAIAVPEGAGS
ncbi:hypothetical protein BCR34DRAFT_199796 [Clohesyomyces aquaticus]|uniref:C2H2-type domain-containing protein n=1 Tax=Clohesyomyces aquaticus TaxID=1231657 RepID=A0A1Y1YCG1_9PLEO|nr:hypothetical protein BCR34DRAFT_199796 [Clohesyomyces aquaticus]